MLNPCPFCGSGDVRVTIDETREGLSSNYCVCGSCGARGPAVNTARHACGMWNRYRRGSRPAGGPVVRLSSRRRSVALS